MSNKKQTAVDYFIQNIESKGNAWENVSIGRIQISISVEDYELLKSHCRMIQKEQLEEAYEDGQDDEYNYHINSTIKTIAINYYNETYGGDK